MKENIMKVARTKRGWSQQEMAFHMGCSIATIRNWETRATIPNLFDAKRIFTEYRLSFQQIVDHFKKEEK